MGYPVTLNGRTYTLADFSGQSYASGFPDALEDFVTDAGAKVTAAASSATAAAASETAAAASAAAAAASVDAIEGFYLGAQASNPTVDLNGAAVTVGDFYFNTTTNQTRIYDGSSWNVIAPDLVGDASPQLGGDLDVNGNAIVSTSNGNIAITPNGTGEVDISKVDIDGGAIDGTVIGGSSAAAGTFTTFTSTGIDDNASATVVTVAGGSSGDNSIIQGVNANQKSGFYGVSASFGFEISDGGVGGKTVRIKNNGTDIFSHNQVQDVINMSNASSVTVAGFTSNGIDDNGTSIAITIDSSQNVGIRETSPLASIHINESDIGSFTPLGRQVAILERSGGSFLSLLSGASSETGIDFGDSGDVDAGSLRFDNDGNYFSLRIADDEKLRLDSSGNLGIGGSPVSSTRRLMVKDSGDVRVDIRSGADTNLGAIDFSDTSNTARGQLVYDHDDDSMQLTTSSAERMRIDSSGNVGIGETSPDSLFHIKGSAVVQTVESSSTSGGSLNFKNGSTTNGFYVGLRGNTTGDAFLYHGDNKDIEFWTNAAQRMVLTNTGRLGIGTTSPSFPLDVVSSGDTTVRVRTTGTTASDDAIFRLQIGGNTADSIIQFGDSDDADAGRIAYHHNGNTMRFFTGAAEEMRLENDGDLHVDGNVIAYSTTISDERLKDDVQDITGALDTIDALRGVTYTWNAGSREGQRDYGVIAQEVEQVIPEIVHDTTMPLLGDEETVYKSVDYEKLCAVLINAVSDLRAEVEELKNGASDSRPN